ncbi:ABC transporter, periplasmic substrate-binding protein [Pseudooceanicola batsensis HTCC2597]|uniref:ABC transporter, periplasmic substrate-binding protein n=2 Tax=Pseudooceanicola batsensis TaxID=314255 RepID=A3TXR6_PSEBH|nr:ABC transporter, periplasmic substrate-binding protein [Pseudooceanicola batsensis HTCC2597]
MYGDPALPPDFVALPYVNPDAPKGGRLVSGNAGGFDSLNPYVITGNPPWQLRFLISESLMYRSQDEPFTVYGLLAESVEVPEDRSWVEFTLREEARFSDGSPVTVEDVMWSYETLGTEGNARYRGLWTLIEKMEQTGPRSVRFTFNKIDRELPLVTGLRPILKKAQFADRSFTGLSLQEAPIGSAPYHVSAFEPARSVTLTRDPDYWGKDLPIRAGTNNFDEIRIEFYGDNAVLFEAFKGGEISYIREFNAEKWNRDYDFPAVRSGDIVLSEIDSGRPSGITGFVMNTRRPPFDDIRVRDAMLHAFNFEYVNETLTGGRQTRITSYFSHSDLGMREGPAQGRVRELLAPFADTIPEGALEGYALPVSDGTPRNRRNIRKAVALLEEAGWSVDGGVLRNAEGRPFRFSLLLRQGANELQTISDLYVKALERLGIQVNVEVVDNAQYQLRLTDFDFDMTDIRRQFSLSPGNDQRIYWGSDVADTPGSRNLMGVASPAIDATIDAMLASRSGEDFTAATRALDRLLTAGRYVIPIHSYDVGRIAHVDELTYRRDHTPLYGDSVYFLPEVWWMEPQ